MAANDVQTATNNWRRRAAQFRANGIPDSTWSHLYQRDMASVMGGSSGMTDADVYAGVSSAVHGPQIQDPTQQHGHGSGLFGVLSGIGQTLGNIPHDISDIIHGAPAGIYNVTRHFPSELTNTGELLYHLAEGDNNWLTKKGYLKQGQQLHESWSDFGLILRAMSANGNKQLLPYVPFLTVAGGLTSAQGRIALEQHPVGSFLDVLPGIAKVGELATAGRDFGFINPLNGKLMKLDSADATALKTMKDNGVIDDARYEQLKRDLAKETPFRTNEPRFWAAGRALQKGNPVKAVVSAAGDIIPTGFKDELGNSMNLRQRTLAASEAMGMSKWQRDGLLRSAAEKQSEFKTFAKTRRHELFKGTIFDGMEAGRAEYLWKVMQDINPTTGEVFRSPEERNAFINNDANMSVEERGAMAKTQDLAELDRKDTIQRGWGPDVNYTDVIASALGTRPTGDVFMTVEKDSPVGVAYQNVMKWDAEVQRLDNELKVEGRAAGERLGRFQAERDIGVLHGTPGKSLGKMMGELEHAQTELVKAKDNLAKAQLSYASEEWRPALTAYLQQGLRDARKDLTVTMTEQELESVIKGIDASTYVSEYTRLMGADKFKALEADAIRWMFKMASEGARPLWIKAVDKKAMNDVLFPSLHEIRAPVPKMYTAKDAGLYMGNTVMDVALALTAAQVEKYRHDVATSYIRDFLIPRSYKETNKLAEYQGALDIARARGAKNLPRAADLVKQNFKPLEPSHYGLSRQELGDAMKGLIVDNDTHALISKMFAPSEFLKHGGRIFQKGTSLYKFAVLTGVRHYTHVLFGGFAFMMLSEPLAAAYLFKAYRMMRDVNKDKPGIDYSIQGLPGPLMGGLKQEYYEVGRQPTWNKSGFEPMEAFNIQTGTNIAEYNHMSWLHEAKTKGIDFLKLVPNKLAMYEENIISMYKIATFLRGRARGLDIGMALEQANKLYVDVNGMSPIERTTIKTIFPFYAFTRHLFRYLFNYPVDHPMRAAIITNFAEGEQEDWKNGLPRSMMNLYHLGSKFGPIPVPGFLKPTAGGDQWTFDMKNMNPFRSFANDFSLAGFTSSMSPFLTSVFAAAGFNTLTGTTQLYPGTYFDPESGSLKATQPAGWPMQMLEGFVPEAGLLDHYFKITQATKILAKVDPAAYQKQLFDMLNMPFVPEKLNIPYEKEITEMRRFRQAQSYVTMFEKQPTAQNLAKLMEFNVVPFDNTLIAPGPLANYWSRVQAALTAMGYGQVSPKAAVRKITPPKARFANFQPVSYTSSGG